MSEELLGNVRAVRDRGRRLAHGGAWLPALLLAALPLASLSLYTAAPAGLASLTIQYPFWAGLPWPQRSALASYLFWLVGLPLCLVGVGLWYRWRERRRGIRVRWRWPIIAGALGLLAVVVLFAAPTGQLPHGTGLVAGPGLDPGQGFLTPLLSVALAAVVLGIVERSPGIVLSGAWMGFVVWQACVLGMIGGLFGWQAWLLGGFSGPAIGGQLTLLGLDRPGPALLAMALPLALVAGYRAVRARRDD